MARGGARFYKLSPGAANLRGDRARNREKEGRVQECHRRRDCIAHHQLLKRKEGDGAHETGSVPGMGGGLGNGSVRRKKRLPHRTPLLREISD